MHQPYVPKKIYLTPETEHCDYAKEIVARFPQVPVEKINHTKEIYEPLRSKPDPRGEGKRYLVLAHDKGRSFKPFPEIDQYLACDYYTLHLEEGCDMECSYCILQTYLTNPALMIYTNIDEILGKLKATLDANPQQFFRIGTGQLADSLSLDPITKFTRKLIPFFKAQPNAVLELKTKSLMTQELLGLSSGGSAIISWSMNARRVQLSDEHKTASISERLEAAHEIVLKTDHQVGFHFDPLIDYEGWEHDYAEVIESIFSKIPENRIAWISLGCLRFMPELKEIMQSRFPKSKLPLAEWVRGMDGKMRYFKPRRIEMYKTMVTLIRKYAPNVTLYLIMETPEVWHHVFGGEHNKETICTMLNTAVIPAKAGIQ